ncbi:unnamed protein product, partial [Sphacelaria rigidula]
FSKEALGKGTGLPPVRAKYALEAILCAIGNAAGQGRTLLVDWSVGVLAARGGVMKFTFVQARDSHLSEMCGADSLEVVHKHTPKGSGAPQASAGRGRGGGGGRGERGGIHAFGKCYIPYTSRGNKEVRC